MVIRESGALLRFTDYRRAIDVDAPTVDHLEPVVADVLRQRGVTRRLSVVHEPAGPEQRDVLLEIADRAVRGHRDAPRHVDRDGAELGRHRRAHEERTDLESWMRLAGEKDLRVRDRGDRREEEDAGQRESEAPHIRTGKNSRATYSSTGSFFLSMPYSMSISCIVRSASMLT